MHPASARWIAVVLPGLAASCVSSPEPVREPPSVAPAAQSGAALPLSGTMAPMYRELLAVDLAAVIQVATARSIDIQQARARLEAARGRQEASVESAFPVLSPGVLFQHFDGANQAVNGALVQTSFTNFLPSVALQWILNPGQVIYDIIASKRRAEAAGHQERASVMHALRTAALQYYDLVLAQAQVGAAQQGVSQAEEALRLAQANQHAGTGLPADELRARSVLAGKRQDLLGAVNSFYQASVALTVTLDLDPTVTLAPGPSEIQQLTLVQDDLGIDRLLALAVEFRPDLQSARSLLSAVDADQGSVAWGALGPTLQAEYSYGGIQTKVAGDTTGMHAREAAGVGAGFHFGLATFGNLRTASANLDDATLGVARLLEEVRGEVVAAQQQSRTSAALIPIAQERVESAREALRLTQAGLEAGTAILLDVLQSQDQLDSARVRYAAAVTGYNEAQVNLLAALGLISEHSLLPAPATAPSSAP